MKSYFRFLSRNKLYTAIELFGFAVALSFIIFIYSFVVGELKYDSNLKGTENIYLGHDDDYAMMSGTVAEQMEVAFPEIQSTCRMLVSSTINGISMETDVRGEIFKQNAIAADKNFFDFFSIPFSDGQRERALDGTNSVVISESFANKYFAGESPIGKSVIITIDKQKANLQITGVFENFEHSVFPETDLIYPIENINLMFPQLLREGNGTITTFYRLNNGVDIGNLESKMLEVLKEKDILFSIGIMKQFHLSEFKKIHFGVCNYDFPFTPSVDLDFVYLFIAAGILLLVFSLLNYLSLTVAQISFRSREMATRRLLGEQKLGIVFRYVKEAFVLTALAFAIAIVLVWVLEPMFSELLGRQINILSKINIGLIIALIAAMIIISLISGLIPALIVSKYKPISIVKGESNVNIKIGLGTFFMYVQNAVSIAVLCIAFAMFLQFKYLIARDSGYNKENIIYLTAFRKAGNMFADELKALPFVDKVGYLQTSPITSSKCMIGRPLKGEQVNLQVMYGDTAAFEILGFRILSATGIRNQNIDGSYWLTESAMKKIGLDYSATSIDFDNGSIPICGIIQDIQRGNYSPADCAEDGDVWQIMTFNGEQDFEILKSLLIKISGVGENDAVKMLADFYNKKGLGEEIAIKTHNQIYRQYFTTENRNLILITISTILTIMLSAMAMIAMSTSYAKRVKKSYSIKKVFGYENREVFLNMVGKFLKIVVISAIIAIPVAYYIIDNWLKSYEYRINNFWWIYAIALFLILTVAFISVSWQALLLMNSNPINSLKKE